MGVRVKVKVGNQSKEDIICRKAICGNITGMNIGMVLKPGDATPWCTSDSNDKLFSLWEGVKSGTTYRMAMTCPKSSRNSAAGYGESGLWQYVRTGTPVEFSFIVGQNDQADWDHGDKYTGAAPPFGVCS